MRRLGLVWDYARDVVWALIGVAVALGLIAAGIAIPITLFVLARQSSTFRWDYVFICVVFAIGAWSGVNILNNLTGAIYARFINYHWSSFNLSDNGFIIAGRPFPFTAVRAINLFFLATKKRINFSRAGTDETVIAEIYVIGQERPMRLIAGPLIRSPFGSSGHSSCRKLLARIKQLQQRSGASVARKNDLAKLIF